MDSPGFFQKRKISKWSKQFWDLTNQGDIASALSIYENHLNPLVKYLGYSLKTAYHFQRWQLFNETKDCKAVEMMAAEESAAGGVKKCLALMKAMDRQKMLATSLNQRDTNYSESTPDGLAEQSEPLENLGLAILRALHVAKGEVAEGAVRQRVKQIVSGMPAPGLLAEGQLQARNRLYLWACWKLKEYHLIINDMEAIASMPAESGSCFLRQVYNDCGKKELRQGEVKEAVQVFGKMLDKCSTEQQALVAISWGVKTLLHEEPGPAIEWFAYHIDQQKEGEWEEWANTLLFAQAVSSLHDGKLIQGCEMLEKLKVRIAESSSKNPLFGATNLSVGDVTIQILNLQCLAKLKETQDWPMSDSADPERSKQILMQNRALWKQLRDYLDTGIEQIGDCSGRDTWKGPLLIGLLAYLESGVALDITGVKAFSASVENVKSETARQKLKAMEGTLTARAKVADEVKDLLVHKKTEELAVLQSEVLQPLGEAIPPLLRAAVFLALWENDSTRNIVTDLRAVASTGEKETLLNECISRAQAIQTLKSLALECSLREQSDKTLPALLSLEFDENILQLGMLAVVVIHIRNKDWRAALETISSIGETDDREIKDKLTYLSFYVAWNINDTDTCQEIIAGSLKGNSFLTPRDLISHAVKSRHLVNAIHKRDNRLILSIITECCDGSGWDSFPNLIISMILWLLKNGKFQEASGFLEVVQEDILATIDLPEERAAQIKRLCVFLRGITTAKLGHYNACIEDFETIISLDVQAEPISEDVSMDRMVQEWSMLFKLQAGLAVTCASGDDVNMKWPSLRRSLEEQSEVLRTTSSLQAYADLIIGLVTFLSADILVDDSTVERLAHVQNVLNLHKRTAFIEQIVDQLNWRKRILNEFWINLSKGRFGDSRAIYQNELEPAFGRRMPNSIRLGMIMADWDNGENTTVELLNRLALLEHEAPELNKELIQKVKNYIIDGNKIRNLTTLMKERKFEEIVEFVQNTEWAGFEKGSMPVAVVVVLLYALFKLRKTEEAHNLGNQIVQSQGLSDWVKDYGFLLVGYIDFEKENYKDAAEAFGKISKGKVLDHNLDKYWAASHFSNGLQLLKVDRKEEAFETFTKSLTVRSGSREDASLAPLFLHFGLKNIELKNGTKALHAFKLLSESLKDSPESSEVYLYQVLADLGQLLCKALIEDEVIAAEDCLEFLDRFKKADAVIQVEKKDAIERVLRIMAICQKFRRERRCDPKKRQQFKNLAGFVKEQVQALELLQEKTEQRDPILLVAKGLVELRTRKPSDSAKPLEWLTLAIRLGVQSTSLVRLLEEHRELQNEMVKSRKGILDLFDVYLTSGEIPTEIKNELVRNDNLGELYRLNRGYSPDELAGPSVKNGCTVTAERMEHLLLQVKNNGFENDNELVKLCSIIESQVKTLKDSEEKLFTTEIKVMEIIARKLRTQSLEFSEI